MPNMAVNVIFDVTHSLLNACFCKSSLFYCANPKIMNTRIISGMLLCCEEKANQMQDENTASFNSNKICGLWFLISYLIGHRTIKMSKSNQSVHGFWIHTVKCLKFQQFAKLMFP